MMNFGKILFCKKRPKLKESEKDEEKKQKDEKTTKNEEAISSSNEAKQKLEKKSDEEDAISQRSSTESDKKKRKNGDEKAALSSEKKKEEKKETETAKEEEKAEEEKENPDDVACSTRTCKHANCTPKNCNRFNGKKATTSDDDIDTDKLTKLINSSIKEAMQTIVEKCAMNGEKERSPTKEPSRKRKDSSYYAKYPAPFKMKEDDRRCIRSKSHYHRSKPRPIIKQCYPMKECDCDEKKRKKKAKAPKDTKTDKRQMTGNVNIYICSEANEKRLELTGKEKKKKSESCRTSSTETTTDASRSTCSRTASVSSSRLVSCIQQKRRRSEDRDVRVFPCDKGGSIRCGDSSSISNSSSTVQQSPPEVSSITSDSVDHENTLSISSTREDCRCREESPRPKSRFTARDVRPNRPYTTMIYPKNDDDSPRNSDRWLRSSTVCVNERSPPRETSPPNSNVRRAYVKEKCERCCCCLKERVSAKDKDYENRFVECDAMMRKKSFDSGTRKTVGRGWSRCSCIEEEREDAPKELVVCTDDPLKYAVHESAPKNEGEDADKFLHKVSFDRTQTQSERGNDVSSNHYENSKRIENAREIDTKENSNPNKVNASNNDRRQDASKEIEGNRRKTARNPYLQSRWRTASPSGDVPTSRVNKQVELKQKKLYPRRPILSLRKQETQLKEPLSGQPQKSKNASSIVNTTKNSVETSGGRDKSKDKEGSEETKVEEKEGFISSYILNPIKRVINVIKFKRPAEPEKSEEKDKEPSDVKKSEEPAAQPQEKKVIEGEEEKKDEKETGEKKEKEKGSQEPQLTEPKISSPPSQEQQQPKTRLQSILTKKRSPPALEKANISDPTVTTEQTKDTKLDEERRETMAEPIPEATTALKEAESDRYKSISVGESDYRVCKCNEVKSEVDICYHCCLPAVQCSCDSSKYLPYGHLYNTERCECDKFLYCPYVHRYDVPCEECEKAKKECQCSLTYVDCGKASKDERRRERKIICVSCNKLEDRCDCRLPIRKCSCCCLAVDICECGKIEKTRKVCVTADTYKPKREKYRLARDEDYVDDCRCLNRPKSYGVSDLAYQRLSAYSDVMSELQQKMSDYVCCLRCRRMPCCCRASHEKDGATKYCVSPKSRRRTENAEIEKSRCKSPNNQKYGSPCSTRKDALPPQICCLCKVSPCKCRKATRSTPKKLRAKCYYCKSCPCTCMKTRESKKPRPCKCGDSTCRVKEKEIVPCRGKA